MGVRVGYVAGRAFIEGFNAPNIDRHVYTSVVVGASGDAGHSIGQNERLKQVQGEQSG